MTNFILHSIDSTVDESLRLGRILVHHMGTGRVILQCLRSRYFFAAFVSWKIRSFQVFDELLCKLRLYHIRIVLDGTRGVVYELPRVLIQCRLHHFSSEILLVNLVVFYMDDLFSIWSHDSASLRVAKYQCGDVLRLILPVQISLKLWRLQRLVNDRASVTIRNREIDRDLLIVDILNIMISDYIISHGLNITIQFRDFFLEQEYLCFRFHFVST
ncbi:hypothetical protein NY2A_b868R [Paramecium bursaria Chlorella virus NY2A]|uniref:Uncharacterized protein b868R n=1 Tax=Paramecium bursaria Chlorella virus NY2A TaxID=46021 RepID=A7IY43_PBCVN|nr:hypothetical protein NY2A_b868R [Paramecium bursaria Chlorella virus NY2A]ABT15267.1 hypothetical protein NY2A_b868R [Paramecium bursaria Chlorella virus NY2A]